METNRRGRILSNGTNSVFRDTAVQSRNESVWIPNRFERFHLFNLILKVLFFHPGKGNESDAAPISASNLTTPHQDTAFLSVDRFLEPYNARLYRMTCLDTDTYYAAIHNPRKIVCPHKVIKRYDPEVTV